jgi:hypothetical protein
MRTFECTSCGALNRVPEGLREQHDHYIAGGHIRWGTQRYTPGGKPMRVHECCGAHADRPRPFVPPGMETKAADECGPECDAGDCGCSNT